MKKRINFLVFILIYLSFSAYSFSADKNNESGQMTENNNDEEYKFFQDYELFDSSSLNLDFLDEVDTKTKSSENIISSIKDRTIDLSLLDVLYKEFVRLNFKRADLENTKNKLIEKINPLREKLDKSTFPQNIKIKNDLEKYNASLHQTMEQSRNNEREIRDILQFLYDNYDSSVDVLNSEIKRIGENIRNYKYADGTHTKRLKERRDLLIIFLSAVKRIKEDPEILKESSPYTLVNTPFDLIPEGDNKEKYKTVLKKIESIEKEIEYFKKRSDELQKEVDELRYIIME